MKKHSLMNGHVVVMPELAEEFDDANGNQKIDSDEKYTDSNGNGKWDDGEQFVDIGNGLRDEGEVFFDCDQNRDLCEGDDGWSSTMGDGEYNLGEPFIDVGDKIWTSAEKYIDSNGNGKWDIGYDYWFKRKIAEHKASNLLAGAALGEKVYKDYNCNTCHSNGMNAGGVGPSFVGLWERKLKEYGSSQDPELDAKNYINESIRYPNRYIVPGYPDQMPKTYTEENGFSNEYISGLIEYIKTLK